MASKLVAKDPAATTVIRDVTPTLTTFSVPFYRFGRFYIGGRATLAKLKAGSLAIFSPVPLTTEIKEKIASQGTLKYIIELDMEHHLQLGPWHEAYPEAAIVAMEGLPEKREKQGNEKVPFASVFNEKDKPTVSAEFDAEFDIEYIGSHANKEIVVNKKDERTLIQADLLFNLGKKGAIEQFSKTGQDPRGGGILSNLFLDLMSMDGAGKAQQRFIWYAASSGNRPAFTESIKRIDTWDFDRMIPCHGEVIETGAKPEFEKMFAWFLTGKK